MVLMELASINISSLSANFLGTGKSVFSRVIIEERDRGLGSQEKLFGGPHSKM